MTPPLATPSRRFSSSKTAMASPTLLDSALVFEIATEALRIHGAYGYSNDYPVERYLRNSKAAVIYEGTSQLHTLIQADYLLGYREDRPLRCPPLPSQPHG